MDHRKAAVRLAVDIGGTFTDVVLDRGDRRFATKVLTTPRAPEHAVVEGTAGILELAGRTFADIDLFVHGTTLATNAVIERKGARTALIATEGFRDVLEIADESRFDQYDIFIEKPKPLVPRRLRFTVPERLDVTGAVRLPLDEGAVRALAQRLLDVGIEAVAISLIHAYVNPVHEQRVKALLRALCPRLSITLSSEVCPEAREYERTSTAVANAYVQPLMAGYLTRLEEMFRARGFRSAIHLMTSGGNLTSIETAKSFPVRLIESGPAGGAILAGGIAAERGGCDILSFDMGGTTAKVCLIENGRPHKARSFEVDRSARFMKGSGMPLRIPVIDLVEIGAGGGSLARVDELDRIQVGPQSAGAEPGPACYGLGGTEPTVTDADLALGKIDPSRFAGGKIKVVPAKAEAALSENIAARRGMTAEDAAYAVAEIVDENMANAARVHAIERGVALAERTLVAFGGAAPLHAARLAEKLGISRILVPLNAGVGSAVGFLEAPAAYELVRSRHMRLDRFEPAAANELLAAMSREATALAKAAAGERPLAESRHAFMRYAGQGHEIRVALPSGSLADADAAELRSVFEVEYDRLFGRHIPGAAIEVMSWVVLVSTAESPPPQLATPPARKAPSASGERSVFDARLRRRLTVPTFERGDLEPGVAIEGPALVLEDGTSTYVSPSFNLSVDGGLALVLTAKSKESAP
jgi:N-methylhydantoinase A